MKISVIVPVYNSEKYIKKCIESIINQSYRDIEIVFINDGSTDGSLNIIQKYKKLDNRIKVINQSNSGVSAARNNGIKNSIGDYITFVDSDDYIDSKMIDKCAESLKNTDLLISGFTYEFKDKNEDKTYESSFICNSKEFVQNYFMESFEKLLLYGPYNKLYKRTIINKYDIKFDEDYSICEDAMFVFDYLLKCEKISGITENFYYYVQHDQSLISKYNSNAFDATWKLYNKIIKFLNANNSEIKNINIVNYSYEHRFLGCMDSVYRKSNLTIREKYSILKIYTLEDRFQKLLIKCKEKSIKHWLIKFLLEKKKIYLFHLLCLLKYRNTK
ncbi:MULTISPECIES: glycosyltransferase family 2 protein [Clostridium]|uniref:Glycosyltransferase family 2 protein n=1 Tax=Clostridium frigoriphilum TaxID=443253 RepID=A0ABU7USC6_9CLOT|nr:glycosyltransferase family 2 protein [Clostridium sp. DSM 17811]MBU3101554.1 glycosyltransferase [Clostridium sp. DSM 17811]